MSTEPARLVIGMGAPATVKQERLYVMLPTDLKEAARVTAEERGLSLNELFQAAVADFLHWEPSQNWEKLSDEELLRELGYELPWEDEGESEEEPAVPLSVSERRVQEAEALVTVVSPVQEQSSTPSEVPPNRRGIPFVDTEGLRGLLSDAERSLHRARGGSKK